MKINTTSPDESKYLQGLANIANPPKSLYFIGKIPENRQPTVTIVGTRRPTPYGREVTLQMARSLAARRIVIVSGLAIGVDALAHQGALEAGGTTIAVLPSGLDEIYPRTNRGLASKILENNGALLTEYDLGHGTPRAHQFLERNRIGAGLGDAVVVIEAARRSGTLNTVMHGLDQGKTIYAVPGNITSPMSAGCNYLIQQGAIPLTDPQQVLDQLGMRQQAEQTELFGDSDQENAILQLITQGVSDGDDILAASHLAPDVFSQTMTMLELKGSIRALGANQWGRG